MGETYKRKQLDEVRNLMDHVLTTKLHWPLSSENGYVLRHVRWENLNEEELKSIAQFLRNVRDNVIAGGY